MKPMRKKLLSLLALTLALAWTAKSGADPVPPQCSQVAGHACVAGTTTTCLDAFTPRTCTCLVRAHGSGWICLGPLVP
jgi:hypothetical protein